MPNQVDLVIDKIQRHIRCGDLNQALDDLKAWVQTFAQDERLMGNVFGARELDSLCLQIADLAIASRGQSGCSEQTQTPVDCVFVASMFYMTGGHTAMVEDYIRALEGKTTRILITDPDNASERQSIIDRLSVVASDVRFSPADSSALAKLNWLIDELAIAKPLWTFFANHPYDSIAVAGMHKSLLQRRAFIHHTDHTFTLGLYVDVDKHIDFRKGGWHNCRHQLGIIQNQLIPLSVQDQGCPSSAERFLSDGVLVTCTSGNNKFESNYSYQLAKCIPQWLKTTQGRHIHIGQLSEKVKEEVSRQLQTENIPVDKFINIAWVESLWQALLAHKVDFYIDSFPLCGCRALVEAMGAGVPVCVHHNYRHHLFSNQDFAYEDAFVWVKPEDLTEHFRSIDQNWLKEQSRKARAHYQENHMVAALMKNLADMLDETTSINIETSSNYQLNPLRAFFDNFADPVPVPNSDRMLQLVSMAKALDLPSELFEKTLESQFSPPVMERYRQYCRTLANQVQVMELIDQVYPLAKENRLDKERLSRLLFAISRWEDRQKAADHSRPSRLLHRCQSLFRGLVKLARSPR